MEETFHHSLRQDPADEVTWLALADWLEENGQAQRAQLVRLDRQMRASTPRAARYRGKLQKEIVKLLEAGVRPSMPEITNSVGMRLALIAPGVFRMGSHTTEKDRFSDEGPLHDVEITKPLYLGVFPVTQEQYRLIRRSSPSHFSATGGGREAVADLDTRDFPVESVTRDDALAFCKRLTERAAEKSEKRTYRLPTEAEWEYACRAGTLTPFFVGTTLSSRQANFNGNPRDQEPDDSPNLRRTCAVGSYRPNAWGLYDMHGNVWEWCSDGFDVDYYHGSPRVDPRGPASGTDSGTLRGGCWSCHMDNLRSAIRFPRDPNAAGEYFGFRVACEVGR